jgi:hypothetical protein
MWLLIIVVVEAVDVSIDLVGTFGFVVCRFVHVSYVYDVVRRVSWYLLAFFVLIGLFNIVVLLFLRRHWVFASVESRSGAGGWATRATPHVHNTQIWG